MELVDATKACTIGWPRKTRHKRRRLDDIRLPIVHRTHLANTAELTAAEFVKQDLGTGRKMPYHFVIEDDGAVKQCLPLTRIGPGAKGVNKVAVHIAIHGDLRKKGPTLDQARSLTELAADMCCLARTSLILGHDEVQGGSADPDKECPGSHLSMEGLREIVSRGFVPWPTSDAKQILKRKGYVV